MDGKIDPASEGGPGEGKGRIIWKTGEGRLMDRLTACMTQSYL